MSSLTPISTTGAAAAVGAYSQAMRAGNLVYTAGCLGLDPESKAMVEGGVEAQTLRALQSLKAIVEASGSSLDKIVKTTVFVYDMNDFQKINTIYSEFFGDHKPARSLVQVARLPLDALIEIECVAITD